jgi:hypothetical protein
VREHLFSRLLHSSRRADQQWPKATCTAHWLSTRQHTLGHAYNVSDALRWLGRPLQSEGSHLMRWRATRSPRSHTTADGKRSTAASRHGLFRSQLDVRMRKCRLEAGRSVVMWRSCRAVRTAMRDAAGRCSRCVPVNSACIPTHPIWCGRRARSRFVGGNSRIDHENDVSHWKGRTWHRRCGEHPP